MNCPVHVLKEGEGRRSPRMNKKRNRRQEKSFPAQWDPKLGIHVT